MALMAQDINIQPLLTANLSNIDTWSVPLGVGYWRTEAEVNGWVIWTQNFHLSETKST